MEVKITLKDGNVWRIRGVRAVYHDLSPQFFVLIKTNDRRLFFNKEEIVKLVEE